jgi:hypothetical protein
LGPLSQGDKMQKSIENMLCKILGRMCEMQQQLKMVNEVFKHRPEPNLVKLFDMLELSMKEQIEAMTTVVKRDQVRDKTRIICDYCKRPGHIKRNCFELVGYPAGWQARQHNKSLANGNTERRQSNVHFTSAVSTSKQSGKVAKTLEEYKCKFMSASDDGFVKHCNMSPTSVCL